MNISKIYEKYMTPKNLQEHMLRVAALSKIIADNWTGKTLDSLAIIKACAIHDISKPVNFDISKEAQEKYNMDPADVANLEKLKNYIKEKFGTDEHEAAVLICNEEKFGKNVADILGNIEWEYMERLLKENDLNSFIPLRENPGRKPEGKRSVFASEGFRFRRSQGEEDPTVRLGSFIALYCDMRVGPKGILPLQNRFEDLMDRGRGDKHLEYLEAAKKCEELIQGNTNVNLNLITDADLNSLFPELLNIQI